MVVAQKNPKFLIFRRSLVIQNWGIPNFKEKAGHGKNKKISEIPNYLESLISAGTQKRADSYFPQEDKGYLSRDKNLKILGIGPKDTVSLVWTS